MKPIWLVLTADESLLFCWKGIMSYLMPNGYLSVHRYENHKPIKKYVHREIWEMNKGKIPDGHEIHHKNGNKIDNKIENLELKEKSEHKKLHHIGRIKYPQFYEIIRDMYFNQKFKICEIEKILRNQDYLIERHTISRYIKKGGQYSIQ